MVQRMNIKIYMEANERREGGLPDKVGMILISITLIA